LASLIPIGLETTLGAEDNLGKGKLFNALDRLIHSISENSQSEFAKLRYVPPLRKIPARHFDVTGAEEKWQQLFGNRHLLEKVNMWLGAGRSGSDYQLVAEEYISRSDLERRLPGLIREELIKTAIARENDGTSFSDEIGTVVEVLKGIYSKLDIKKILYSHPDILEQILDFQASGYAFEHERNPDAQGHYFKGMSVSEIRKFLDEQLDWEEFVSLDALEQDSDSYGAKLFLRWASEQSLMQELFGKFDGINPDYASRSALDGVEFELWGIQRNVRREILLRDTRRNHDVSLQDVGVGISQVLPVILSAYGEKNKLIAIEQPEIHIHPALQADLADVFIESALGENKNSLLLETHSEHLILRILRRIRETTEGLIEDWPEALREACPNGIRPEDVAVLYVESGDEGAKVVELSVDAYGEFTSDWPGGFFEERLKELGI
jgi:hypothetical protein